jgi:hypothetical protein
LGQRITRSCCFIASITRPSIQSNKVRRRRGKLCLLVTVVVAPATFVFFAPYCLLWKLRKRAAE